MLFFNLPVWSGPRSTAPARLASADGVGYVEHGAALSRMTLAPPIPGTARGLDPVPDSRCSAPGEAGTTNSDGAQFRMPATIVTTKRASILCVDFSGDFGELVRDRTVDMHGLLL